MKKLIIIKAILVIVGIAVMAIMHSSCTKAPHPNVVEVQVQGANIIYNYAYGYEGKIYAIDGESTTMVNMKARRLYYIQGTNIYTDTITSQDINLNKDYYNGFFMTANGDKMIVVNIKNRK